MIDRARQIEDRHALAQRLAEIAAQAMPADKADEFAAYLGQAPIDRRWLNRQAPAILPRVTINDPTPRRRARPGRRSRAQPEAQLPLF